MKNIFLIPTDKPSRLHNTFNVLRLEKGYDLSPSNLNLYITNEEKPKQGDWGLDKFNQKWKLENKKLISFDRHGIKRFSTYNILWHECKKIIITTDPKLIGDGIQAIDDEFLEWFVKNPSCEEVEVAKTNKLINNYADKDEDKWEVKYHIYIPKEEPKQNNFLKSIEGSSVIKLFKRRS